MHDPVDAYMHDCIASQLQWAAAMRAISKCMAELFVWERLVIALGRVFASMM